MDFEDEPMDVDLSSNSIRYSDSMDISYNEPNHAPFGIKIKEEPIETRTEDCIENITINEIHTAQSPIVIKRYSLQRKDHKSMSNKTISVIVIVASLFTLLMYQIVKFECSKELDLKALKYSLVQNVIGQQQAIEHIIESLEVKSSSKILFLVGGTGVGKTLTISHLLENLHHYANIYHYTMPSFFDTFSADLMLGLTFCPTSMIVVDDLNGTDMHVKEHIQRVIEKSENLNKNITVILVYNCDIINDYYVKKCDHSFSTDLLKSFEEIKTLKQVIKFNSLSEEHLRLCIEKELGDKILNHREFENIVRNFNVSVDGCKGVYRKIKLLNIN